MSCNRNTLSQFQTQNVFKDVYNPNSYRTNYDIALNNKFCCNKNIKETYQHQCKNCKYPLRGKSNCTVSCPDCAKNQCYRQSGLPHRRRVVEQPHRSLAFDDTDNPYSYRIHYNTLS